MKISKILIAQPGVASANPHYANLIKKYGVSIEFHPFFSMVPLTLREFRTQKVNIPDYTAIVFTSKGTIDAFFQLCAEQRLSQGSAAGSRNGSSPCCLQYSPDLRTGLQDGHGL